MGLISMLLAIVLSTFLVPATSRALDDETRCQSAFVHHGTELFDDVADIEVRCRRDHLRRSVPNDTGCPTTEQFDVISEQETAALTKIDGTCTAALGTSGLCTLYAAEEAFDVVDVVFGGSTAPEPDGAVRRCREALGSQSVRLAEFKARVLRRCNESALRGAPGYGPVGAACESPSGTQAAVADAEARVRARIEGKCGIPPFDPQDDLGFGASCGGKPYCEFAIATLPDLIDCVSCVANAEVDQLSRGFAALPLDTATSCSVGRAQYFLSLLDDDLRDLADCEERILDGNGTGPCPDLETAEDLAFNENRYVTRLVNASCAGSPDPPPDLARLLALELTDSLYPNDGEETDNDVKRCRSEIGRSVNLSSGNARRKLRALRACHAQRLCGQKLAACPDSEANASIASGVASAASGITSRCDGYTPSFLGFGSCPSVGSCGALPNTTLPELIACLQCVTDAVVDGAVALAVP